MAFDSGGWQCKQPPQLVPVHRDRNWVGIAVVVVAVVVVVLGTCLFRLPDNDMRSLSITHSTNSCIEHDQMGMGMGIGNGV